MSFQFELPGFETSTGEIKGIARIVRLAGANRFGMVFLTLEPPGPELLRRYLMIP